MSLRYSRSDIMTLGLNAGLTYEETEDVMFDLSPECQTVPSMKVMNALQKALDSR